MELTEYDKKTFKLIEGKLTVGKWYSIDENRHDFKELVGAIDKFDECYGLVEWADSSKTRYRIVLRPNVVAELANSLSPIDPNRLKNLGTSLKLNIPKHIDENRHPQWSIPGVEGRNYWIDSIKMQEEEDKKRYRERDKKQSIEKQKLEKIKAWKNNH